MVIRCTRCGAVLGQEVAGHLVVVHRRRELVIDLPARVVQRCDNCGTLNAMLPCEHLPRLEVQPVAATAECGGV